MSDSHDDAMGNDFGEVRRCDCGGINLVIGPMTLHLVAEEVEELHALSAAAIDMLNAEPEHPVPPHGEPSPKPDKTVH